MAIWADTLLYHSSAVGGQYLAAASRVRYPPYIELPSVETTALIPSCHDEYPLLPKPQASWERKQAAPFVLSIIEMAGAQRGSTPLFHAASA